MTKIRGLKVQLQVIRPFTLTMDRSTRMLLSFRLRVSAPADVKTNILKFLTIREKLNTINATCYAFIT